MARIIALTAPAALGLAGAPVHEPVHAWGQAIPIAVTQRDTINIRRTALRATRLDARKAHLHGVALSVVAAGSSRAVRADRAEAVRVNQQAPPPPASVTWTPAGKVN